MKENNSMSPTKEEAEGSIVSQAVVVAETTAVPVVKQVIAVTTDKKMPIAAATTASGNQEPLCEDILSCISALDDVIAEFDDSISQSSILLGCGGDVVTPASGSGTNLISSQPQPQPPKVTCSVNKNSFEHPEPIVKILQTHSQTVTEIQISSSSSSSAALPPCTGAPSHKVVEMSATAAAPVSPTKQKSPSRVQQNQQQQNEPLQLKQSHFSPVKSPKKTASESQIPYQVEISTENKSPNGNFTSYGIIFPKVNSSPVHGAAEETTGSKVITATTTEPPAPFPRTRRSAAAGKMSDQGKQPFGNLSIQASGGGGSFPKVKEPIYEVIAESQSQSVKVRPSPMGYKPMPLFIAETTPAEELAKEQKRAKLLKAEEWSFISDDKLPRSLRKTRRTCLDEDEDESSSSSSSKGMSMSKSASSFQPSSQIEVAENSNCPSTPKNPHAHVRDTHAVQLHVAAAAVAAPSTATATGTSAPTNLDNERNKEIKTEQEEVRKGQTKRGNEGDIWRMPVTQKVTAASGKNKTLGPGNGKGTYSKASGSCDAIGMAMIPEKPGQPQSQPQAHSHSKISGSSMFRPPFKSPAIPPVAAAAVAGPPAAPILDVDDGYLSMINRHEAPILWPEGFIESETFSAEELKTLAVHLPEVDFDTKTRMSGATDKTDYFSDDSLEFEGEGDEPRTFIISGPSILNGSGGPGPCPDARRKSLADVQNFRKFSQEATSRKSWSVPSAVGVAGGGGAERNVWRIGTPEPNPKSRDTGREISKSVDSSPVRKPCAFFIPLNEPEVCERQEGKDKANANAKERSTPVVSEPSPKVTTTTTVANDPSPISRMVSSHTHILKANSEAFVFDFSEPKPVAVAARNSGNRLARNSLNDYVESMLGNVLKTGIQEADAINYLLAAPDDDEIKTQIQIETQSEIKKPEIKIEKQVLPEPEPGPSTQKQQIIENPIVVTLEEDLVEDVDDSSEEEMNFPGTSKAEVTAQTLTERYGMELEIISVASSGKATPSEIGSNVTETSFLSVSADPMSQVSSFCSDAYAEEEDDEEEIHEEEENEPKELICAEDQERVSPILANIETHSPSPIPQVSSTLSAVLKEIEDPNFQSVNPTSPTDSIGGKIKFDFIEDLHDQPPPFVPAPPPISVVVLTEPKQTAKDEDSDDDEDGFNSNPIPEFLKCDKLRPEKHFRSIQEADRRSHIQRQASRSHENLVDIVGRRYGYLSPTGSHGHSSTLPPNSVPPVHRRRSALRTFIDYFKRGKKLDINTQIEAPEEHFFPEAHPPDGKCQYILNGTQRSMDVNFVEHLNVSRISINDSPRGSQRSTSSRSTAQGKKSVLSRIFRRKEK